MMYLALHDETRSGSGLPDIAVGKGQHRRVNSVSASRAPAVGAGPGDHTAGATRDGSWRWLGRRGSLARRLLLSYGVVVLVDVAVFVSTDLYMTPRRLGAFTRSVVLANEFGAVATAAVISLIVGAVTAALLPRLLLDPLRQLRRSTRSLMEGRYTESVPEPRLPELSDLTKDVNVLAARLADLEVRRARLVSDVAHELRTPLTIIAGQLAGVEDGVYALDSDLIASLREELDRLHRLTEDLSGLSRAEESAYELRRARTDLAALCEDVTSRLRPQFTHAGIELRQCTSARAGADVDPHRITQILTNLLRNALTATPPGGTVTVTTSHADHTVTIEVTDTGRGIAPADLERIFERFERVAGGDEQGNPDRAGSGIGLTIARSLARAHGGELSATSGGVGRGTTMTLALPADPDPVSAERDAEEPGTALGGDPQQPKVPARSGMFRAPRTGRVGAGPTR
jgi:signal transduction histidine kinase